MTFSGAHQRQTSGVERCTGDRSGPASTQKKIHATGATMHVCVCVCVLDSVAFFPCKPVKGAVKINNVSVLLEVLNSVVQEERGKKTHFLNKTKNAQASFHPHQGCFSS